MKAPLRLVAFGLLATAACKSSNAFREHVEDGTKDWGYFHKVGVACWDALLDFADIFPGGVNVSAGQGAWVNAQATKVAHVGAGYFDGVRIGFRPRAFGAWSERRGEGGLSVFYWRDLRRQPIWGTTTLFAQGAAFRGFDLDHQREDGHWTEFEVGAHFLFGGFQITARPREVADFVGSLLNIPRTIVLYPIFHYIFGVPELPEADLCEDNVRARMRREGGDPAGYIHQPDTPFFERPRETSLGQKLDTGG